MAKKIDFQVGFNVNKNDLAEVQKLLSSIINQAKQNENSNLFSKDLAKAANEADRLQVMLNKAWNNKLGQLDLSKLNSSIKTTYGSVEQLKTKLESVGRGDVFNKLQSSVLNTNLQLKQSNKLLDDMATSMANTVKWGITSSIFNNVTTQIQKAYDYSVRLDTSLNDIRIVSNKSADDMERFAVQANKAAKALGSSTLDYTRASTIYYQQGLSDEEVAARTDVTLKAANVTGQKGADVSEQLTAIWNGYKVSAQEAELYIDKVAKVAASTAADLEEMATGMSKVASAANSAGVDIDQLNGMLATVISVTREAPETIGTSFRSIFARIGDLALGGEDEYGVTLGKVSGQMQELGIQILDQQGEMRNMGDIVEDLAAKWQTWTQAQRQAAAVAIAGKQQYSRLIALMDNWDMYQQAVQDSQGAVGELQREQDIYMESTAAHLQKLSTEAERTYDILFDQDTVNDFSDALTGALNIFNNFLATTGGGLNSLITLGGMLGNVFSKQIGSGIGQMVQNKVVGQQNEAQQQALMEMSQVSAASDEQKQVYEEMRGYSQQILGLSKNLSTEQYNQLKTLKEQAEADKLKLSELEKQNEVQRSMAEIDADILNQNKLIKEQSKSYADIKKEVDSIEAVRSAAARTEKGQIKYVEDRNKILQSQREILESINLLSDEGLLSTEQQATLQKALDRDGKDRILTQKQITDLDEIAQTVLTQQVEKEKELTREKELQAAIDRGELDTQRIKAQQSEGALQSGINLQERNIAIQETVKGMTSLISLTTSFVGIVKTLNDDSLSGWEKFERVGSTLLITLPMLITNFSAITRLMPNLAVSIGAVATGAKVGFGEATVAVLTFETALGPLWLVLLAVAAAIGAVVAIGYSLVKAYNADADAAKEARQSVTELTTAYEECKNKVEELKNAMSQYDDAVDSLKDLKENTDEYKEALEKANEEARKLIEQYGLFGKFTYDEKGLIKIDEDALKEAITNAEQKVEDVYVALQSAKIMSTNADLKSQRTDFARQVGMLTKTYDKSGLYLEGTTRKSGERTSESIQIDDKSINNIINGLNQIRESDQGKYSSLFDKGNEEILKNTILAFDDITPAVRENIDQVLKQKDALQSLTESTYKAAEANGFYASQVIGDIVQSKYEKQFEAFATKGGKVDNALAQNLSNAMKTLTIQADKASSDSLQKKIASIDVSKVKSTGDLQKYEEYKDVKNDVDLIRRYAADIKGIDWDTINQHVVIDDGWGKGTMTTDEGEVLIKDKNDEQMRRELAAKAETDRIRKEYEENNKDFNDKLAQSLQDLAVKASEFGSQYGTDFSKAMLSSIASGSQEFDFSSLFGDIIDPDAVPAILDMSTEDLMTKMGLDEQKLKDLGYTSGDQWAAAFKAGFEGYQWDMDTALAAAMEKRDSEIDTLGLSKKKAAEYKEEIQDYGKHLMRIAKDSEDFADSLDKDAESAVIAAQSIIEMNKGIDALADGFKDWADVLKKSTKESQEYSEALNGIKDALSLIYGVESDYISNNFVTEHLKEIEQAATGSETAIEKLRGELAEDIIVNIALYNGLDQNVQNDLLNMIHELETQIPDIKVGTEIDIDDATYSDFLQTMQDIINTAGLTAEQANALFSTMGFDTNFATEEKDIEQTSPNTVTETTVVGYTRGVTKGPDGEDREWEYPKLSTSTYQDGTSTHTGKMTVMAMATSPDGTKVPQIQSITKKGSGKHSNYSSQNKGGKSPGSGSGKKGGGSKKEPQKEKPLETKIDPYHDVDIKIKTIEDSLDNLQSQQSKFFGQKLINNLSAQYELLGKQIDADKEKIAIARKEQKKLADELSAKGVAFRADGTIANYAEAYNAQLNYVNSIISKYNAMSAEEQEKYKETVDKAKEDFNKFTEAIGEYDKTITDIIPGLEKDIQGLVDKQIEIQITKFNMEIEIRLNMAEAERDWNAFKKKVIDGIKDTDILGNAKASLQDFSSYYKESGEGIIQVNTQHVEDVLTELKQMDATGLSNVYGDNRTAALEDLKKYNDQLMSDLENMVDLVDEIKKSYLDMMDKASEKLNEQLDMYEHISDLIEHDMNVIQLVYGEESYSKLSAYYKQQEDNYNRQLDFQRQQVDFWKQQMEVTKDNEKEFAKAKEEWLNAVQEWNAAVENAIQNLQDKYLNAINEIFQELNNKVTGGLGLDYVGEQWELINKNADQYLDTINSMYAIQQLQKKYQDAIDDTDNVSQQRKLNQLMNEEIKALEEKDKLTQYDVDRAELKYQIALKQIALQEAQQNKSTMRLRRDSQGNYSYQYVADNDQVSSIQEEMSNLYNQLYNMDINQYRDNLDQIYSVWEEFQEKMAEAAQINDPEARAEKELLLKEQYGELINGLTEQNETIRTNIYESSFLELADLYQTDYENFTQLAQDEQELLVSDMIPQWESGVQQMANAFGGEEGFYGVCKDAFDKLDLATQDYEQSLKDLQESAGQNFEEISNGIDNTINNTEQLLWDNQELIESYENELKAIKEVIDELDSLIAKYKEAENAAKAATEEAYRYWQAEQQKAAQDAKKDQNSSGDKGDSSKDTKTSKDTNKGSDGPKGSGDGIASIGDTATLNGKYYYDSYGTSPAGSKYSGVANGVVIDKINNNPYGIHIHSADGKYGDLGWVKKSQLSGYDTGGYTGNWGDNSGKLALLHKKELVLNAGDTENMLNMLEIMRGITQSIDSNMLMRMAGMLSGVSSSSMGIAANNDTLEQNVHIEANFPNVTKSDEIEKAIHNLNNIASQRINRNRG